MSLSQQLERQLTTAGTGPAHLSAQDGADRVVCELVAIESLGVSALMLRLESKQLEGVAADRLKQIADDLASRVSYLLEAIAPIEIDQEAAVVQMRSKPPHRAENATSYYEILVAAGAISLRRYCKARRTAREPEAFDITRQVLARLVDDFADAAASA